MQKEKDEKLKKKDDDKKSSKKKTDDESAKLNAKIKQLEQEKAENAAKVLALEASLVNKQNIIIKIVYL